MRDVIVAPMFAHHVRDWHLPPGRDTGDFVFFSGVTGTRPDGSIAADPRTQFRDAFGFLGANLAQVAWASATWSR